MNSAQRGALQIVNDAVRDLRLLKGRAEVLAALAPSVGMACAEVSDWADESHDRLQLVRDDLLARGLVRS